MRIIKYDGKRGSKGGRGMAWEAGDQMQDEDIGYEM